ncbi:thioredoxin family protein [Rubrivirga sp. S365]|uniref:Thioredoxin family protein n=1 Tax=Rubrivirga litoralis TaxID=3075598 RepID=A0ABU3BVD2_9BACT|nr:MULTISPECIES: thioredoxin family protein [unclassified Rubrivirga]MDT0633248.1 thioredoxin family protein [Rubrivirga sp. F394]MDT7857896.1 thioredoxin family protein [Rubrivirga sp. S365]
MPTPPALTETIGADRSAAWDRAQTFAEFLPTAEDNVGLWEQNYSRARIPQDLADRAEGALGTWRLLVLSEDWCGDAANTVPVLAAFADAVSNLDLRLLARDENLDLMDEHLTGTSRSIPVVLVLDGDGVERAWWGPRPVDLQAWVMGPGKEMEPSDRYREVRKWYARDHGRTTVMEVVERVEQASGAGRVA